ncbi:hypothetical protein [Nostoc sp. DedQUE04]|uniref:hypothetical protein n=1 Tax=Nostoc sp. DedQUE04 TaxID=3075390 RepID=UPI002AD3C1BE|nr:hypothetical protein [Nostoc sp. DedQUE04]
MLEPRHIILAPWSKIALKQERSHRLAIPKSQQSEQHTGKRFGRLIHERRSQIQFQIY